MKDLIRNLLSIRQKRKTAPVGPLPQVGAGVDKAQFRMKVRSFVDAVVEAFGAA